MKKPRKPRSKGEIIWEEYAFCNLMLEQIRYMDSIGTLFKDKKDPNNMPLSAIGAACMNHLMERIMRRSPEYLECTRISREEYNVMIKVATEFLALIKGDAKIE